MLVSASRHDESGPMDVLGHEDVVENIHARVEEVLDCYRRDSSCRAIPWELNRLL